MPLKKANKIRRNFTLDPEVVAKIEILSKYLEFQINYSQIVEKAINDLFEKKIGEEKDVKIAWEARKSIQKRKVIQINKDRGKS